MSPDRRVDFLFLFIQATTILPQDTTVSLSLMETKFRQATRTIIFVSIRPRTISTASSRHLMQIEMTPGDVYAAASLAKKEPVPPEAGEFLIRSFERF